MSSYGFISWVNRRGWAKDREGRTSDMPQGGAEFRLQPTQLVEVASVQEGGGFGQFALGGGVVFSIASAFHPARLFIYPSIRLYR